ncbi:carbonic anhydrase-related protein 10-like, partial [Penaeus japonicus]|uniref:carbonic anhydrase-related protein 10-like n=1 Tax=Penaeus japonicus TaxID=27405 RepID=UPI001C713D5D
MPEGLFLTLYERFPRTLIGFVNIEISRCMEIVVHGQLVNTGHSLEWRVRSSGPTVNLSGGPLSYVYTVSHLRLHFGERDLQGSEHTVANYAFPAELQIYGFNAQLYRNFSQAASQVYGVVGVAVMVQLGDETTPALASMLENLSSVRFGAVVSVVVTSSFSVALGKKASVEGMRNGAAGGETELPLGVKNVHKNEFK